MSPSLMAAGGLALACGVLLWRLLAAHRKIGKLKHERSQSRATIRQMAEEIANRDGLVEPDAVDRVLDRIMRDVQDSPADPESHIG